MRTPGRPSTSTSEALRRAEEEVAHVVAGLDAEHDLDVGQAQVPVDDEHAFAHARRPAPPGWR